MTRIPLPPPQPPQTLLQAFLSALDERLEQIADKKIAAALEAHNAQSMQDEVMTRADLCTEFDVCTQTVRSWEREGILNPLTIGRRVFYNRSEVLATLKSRTKPDGTRLYARRKVATNKTR